MYPNLTIGSRMLSMTGIGIVIFILVFALIARKKANLQGLQFRALLRFLPISILLAYFLGTRTWYFFSDHIVLPLVAKQRLLYLSPYGYHFHFVGVLAGLAIGRTKFLKTQRRETHHLWRAILFESLCLATIPLGIFLLLGDHFIGKPISSGRYISAIDPESTVATYDTVIPLGIYLSVFACILYFGIALAHTHKPHIRWPFIGLILYTVGRGILLIRQIYPRHLVMKMGSITLDIKQYACVLIAGLIAWQLHKHQNSIQKNTQ